MPYSQGEALFVAAIDQAPRHSLVRLDLQAAHYRSGMSTNQLAEGYARIHVVFAEQNDEATPGLIAKTCGLAPEAIGMIRVDNTAAFIDVLNDEATSACEQLASLGKATVVERNVPPPIWEWLYMNVGRTHGMTMGYLRKFWSVRKLAN